MKISQISFVGLTVVSTLMMASCVSVRHELAPLSSQTTVVKKSGSTPTTTTVQQTTAN